LSNGFQEIRKKAVCGGKCYPVGASKYGAFVAKAGADLFFVQATVVSTTHLSAESVTPLDLAQFCREMPIPVVLEMRDL